MVQDDAIMGCYEEKAWIFTFVRIIVVLTIWCCLISEIADDIMLTIIYIFVINITKLVCSSSFAYLCILSLKHLKKEKEEGN